MRPGSGILPLRGAPALRFWEDLRRVNLVFLPHAREQMQERRVSEEQVRETLETPDISWMGRFGRMVAEKGFDTYILRVIYNEGVDEAVIITVIRRRKRGGAR